MTEFSNVRLAELLDGAPRDTLLEPEALLTALFEGGGLLVPVTADGRVVFAQADDGAVVLPGFVSEPCCRGVLPTADGVAHCDPPKLLDILEQTGTSLMAVRSEQGQALFERQTMRDWARRRPGTPMVLNWSTDPLALALRDALLRRIREFPAVRTVWISKARWPDNGEEVMMLHVAVDEALPSATPDRLMSTLLREEVRLGDDHPRVAMLPLNTTVHADTIAGLDRMGLDTVRHDARTGRVEVVSREYDNPPPPAADGAETERRRWLRRS
ncbi:hypothetical protein [Streptomyces sp. TLI_171]|uniref:hypothetical protein n=1 Tax=Streptomyces sp. TLI_171 TaxID=1938859 RepID=UPI000C17DC3E|nr:hypothetical protein [Streptomyces sp. TLI_171]RKE17683.1 hypothetical protein BX266_0945 [Streptomyces sp. TLI_171]